MKSYKCGKFENWEEFQHCLHEHFSMQANKTPKKVAIVDGDRQMTYETLEKKTSQLANFLVRKHGVKVDEAVAIFMDKSIEFVISYIAILKAGGAYSPIETAAPPKLVTRMIEKMKIRVVLTKKKYTEFVPLNVTSFVFENFDSLVVKPNFTAHKNVQNPWGLAYLIPSSGTTGEPKAISCRHIGSIASYFWRIKHYPFEKDDRIGCNIFFTWELLRPLLCGLPLYIIPQEVIYDPIGLCEFIHKNGITRLLLTPSTLQAVFDMNSTEHIQKNMKSIKFIVMCGEVVYNDLFRLWKTTFPKKKLINLYSVSECHDVTCGDIDFLKVTDKYCSTGHIMENCFYYVLDENLNIVNENQVGELYVGGICVAAGYFGQEKLTKERFIKNPFSYPVLPKWIKEPKLYKSGDHARVLSDGSLEVLGRCNSMVKIRGYSVELNAIEAFLNAHKKVSSSCCIKKDERLIAYIIPRDINNITGMELIKYLKENFPFYMIPSVIMTIEKLPISIMGKLNKKELPDPAVRKDLVLKLKEKTILPSTDMERSLSKLWNEAFSKGEKKNVKKKDVKKEEIVSYSSVSNYKFDVEDNFFDVGGNSITLAKLFYSIKNVFKNEKLKGLSLPMLYENNSIRKQAKLIERALESKGKSIGVKIDFAAEITTRFPKSITRNVISKMKQKVTFKKDEKFNVFITGATGYVGSFLIHQMLLDYPNATLHCLVRKEHGKIRLCENMNWYNLLSDDMILKHFESRVFVVKGDFSRQFLGISSLDEYHKLAEEMDVIIHNGADVNFQKTYNQLKGANVIGVHNVLDFSIARGKLKPIVHVSTSGVFPTHPNHIYHREKINEKIDPSFDVNEHISMGYCKAKIIGEKIMVKAMKEFGIPIVIYRPGDIIGDSIYGRFNPNHDLIKLFMSYTQMKKAPSDYRLIDLTPVDFVVKEITKSIRTKTFIAKKLLEENFQFNLIHPERIRMIDIIRYMKKELMYKMKIVKNEEWIKSLKSDNKIECFSLFPVLEKMLLTKKYSDCFYESSVWRFGDLPSPLILVRKMFKRMIEMKKIKETPETQIYGKNAVVIGASVGIGAAISKSLAKNGINVCLSSRRLKVLNEIKTKLERNKNNKFVGDVICKKCDVTNENEVDELVNFSQKKFGNRPIDYLIVNAGLMPATMMKNGMIKEWKKCVDVNINGLLNAIKSFLSKMVDRNKGHIILMSSNAGREVWQTLTVYSASKFFMEAIAKGIRKELYGKNIKISTIQPGDVGYTEILKDNQDQEGLVELEKLICKKYLMPKDIANSVMYIIKQPSNCCVNELLIEPIE